MSSRKSHLVLVLACALALAAMTARAAQPDAAPASTASEPSDVARLQAEVDRLKHEVREQRQLILQLMQAEQQRYDVVLKYLKSGGIGDPSATLPSPKLPGESASPAPAAARPGDETATTATISGRLRTNGPIPGDVYVYVEGLRGSPARNHTVEIKQHDKQFAPRVAVVPVGTRVVFPNQDSVIHNVFSTAPGNAFDLGPVKGGTSTTPVVLLKPGVLEIFCNIHSKMRADVLVVGNPHWTKVAPDGLFQISGVPVGTRKLALWSPALKPARQQVELTANGASVTFLSEVAAARPHMNKRGQAYGSYDE